MTDANHIEVLREMFAECANDRRMKEAYALEAAIRALSPAGGDWVHERANEIERNVYNMTASQVFTQMRQLLPPMPEPALMTHLGRLGYSPTQLRAYAVTAIAMNATPASPDKCECWHGSHNGTHRADCPRSTASPAAVEDAP